MPYFYRLMVAADYPGELIDLGYFHEYDELYSDDPEEVQARARSALEELLSPELRQQRAAERKAAWERQQEEIRREWPYVLNSPSGRALLRQRYREKITYMRPILWIEVVAWIFMGWAFSSWRTTVVGFVASLAFFFTMPVLGEYLQMRRERRDTLLRRGVPDELI